MIEVVLIHDKNLFKTMKNKMPLLVIVMLFGCIDGTIIFIFITSLCGAEYFKVNFEDSMIKVLKGVLVLSIITKGMNVFYSAIQLNYTSNLSRLL